MICSNVSYSSSAPYLKSIASALLTDTAIGAGYAETFALLCYAKGLPVITVTSRIHEWNQVKLGDYWYAVDVMADDDDNIDYDYFNKSDSTIRSYSPIADALHTPKLAPWNAVGRPNCNKDYEGGTTSMPVYRLYNPNATVGAHHYTISEAERENLEANGWIDEGIAWYGVR